MANVETIMKKRIFNGRIRRGGKEKRSKQRKKGRKIWKKTFRELLNEDKEEEEREQEEQDFGWENDDTGMINTGVWIGLKMFKKMKIIEERKKGG